MENKKFYLGGMCKNNHEFENTGKTLRFKSDRSCVECKKIKEKENKEKRNLENDGKFYVGNLCDKGHNHNGENYSLRYTSSNDCIECKRISDKNSYIKRQEKILNQKKQYYLDNKEAYNLKNKEYYLTNKDGIITKNKEYYKNNKKHLNAKNWERIKIKLATDPIFRLNRRMSNAVTKALKRKNTSKGGISYLDLVDFTLEDLVAHLEKQFTEGMNWDNYDEWHIDHIKPKSTFDYETPNDLSFKECWSLSNFQPLWGKDNLSKGKKSMEDWLIYKNKK